LPGMTACDLNRLPIRMPEAQEHNGIPDRPANRKASTTLAAALIPAVAG
jgi:hypothetical protein